MERGAIAHLRPVWFRCPGVEKQREDRPRTEGPQEFFTDKHEQVRWLRGDVCLRQEQLSAEPAQQVDLSAPKSQALHLVKSGHQGFLPGTIEETLQGKG